MTLSVLNDDDGNVWSTHIPVLRAPGVNSRTAVYAYGFIRGEIGQLRFIAGNLSDSSFGKPYASISVAMCYGNEMK